MNNYQHYEKEIIEIMTNRGGGQIIALSLDGKPISCSGLDCRECKLDSKKNHCSQELKQWLESEYQPQILDNTEKEYLSNVIEPFKEKVKYIRKSYMYSCKKIYICIELRSGNRTILPYFENENMYKGMKAEKGYTLEELGLKGGK